MDQLLGSIDGRINLFSKQWLFFVKITLRTLCYYIDGAFA